MCKPTIKQSTKFKSIIELIESLDNYIIGKHYHNCRQHVLNAKTDSVSDANTSSCEPIPFKNLITVTMLNKLTIDVQNLEEMKLLNVRLHEEKHVTASFMKDENVSNAMINLHRYQKRK